MKRSGFKKKPTTPLKRTRLKAKPPAKRPKRPLAASKKRKAPSTRILKKKLWEEVKRITREKYGDTCYTCGARHLEGRNRQAGHGKPMGALPLRFKYDVRNIRPQCMVCNIHRGGVTDIFIARLEREPEGLAFLQEACYRDEESRAWRIRQDIPLMGSLQASQFLQDLLSEYSLWKTTCQSN